MREGDAMSGSSAKWAGSLKWKPNGDGGWDYSLYGVFELTVAPSHHANKPGEVFWECHWRENWDNGHAATVELAKRAAMNAARTRAFAVLARIAKELKDT